MNKDNANRILNSYCQSGDDVREGNEGSGLTCTWRIFNNRAHCWEEKIANTTWTKKRPHVLQAAAAAAAAAAESSAS